jgi:hypothetical protein
MELGVHEVQKHNMVLKEIKITNDLKVDYIDNLVVISDLLFFDLNQN